MKRVRRLAGKEKDSINLAVFIRIGSNFNHSGTKRLADFMAILRRRFQVHIVLGMEDLVPLGEQVLSKWLGDGLIDQSICSGNENLILNDLVDAAIRSMAPSSVFVDAADLLRSPASTLKFIVQCLGVESGTTLDSSGNLFHSDINKLLAGSRINLSENWQVGLQKLHAANTPYEKKSSELAESGSVAEAGALSPTPRHLFVTKSGVNRLGGIDRFKQLPICVGGAAVSDFKQVTVLTLGDDTPAENTSSKQWSYLTAIRPAASGEESVIFDIWPAPHKIKEPALRDRTSWIDVPRQILVGRRCPIANDQLRQTSAHQAVFIMSNFNKVAYLPAALYGWVMQMHGASKLEIVDDISTDESVSRVQEFQRLTGLGESQLKLRVITNKRGTYWIRNYVISEYLDRDAVLFINDSDDVSSALRATLQLGAMAQEKEREACLFNIVRVDKTYSPLPLNNEVERYGTASLCFRSSLIRKSGYFQNIKKNADTEFIRRINRFFGGKSIPWLKFSVMFQVFDGNNLTADIYQLREGNEILANLNSRKLHIQIADDHHGRLTKNDLPLVFGFPSIALPEGYSQLGDEFLID